MIKPRVFEAKVDDGQFAHNYSIQTMNSTSLAKELLHKEMAKVRMEKMSKHTWNFLFYL